MALYYEVRNYLLKPDKHICRLTFNDQPLARTWRLGKLRYTLDSTKIDQEANQPAQNHFEEEFMSDEYNVFDEFVGGLEQIDYLTDYMNYGISLQLVVFDDEKGKTKTISRKDYTFDDFDKDVVRRNIYDPNYDPNNEYPSYIVYAQELEADPYTSKMNKTGAYTNRSFVADGSNEDVYLETTVLGIASELTALISPEDLFYESIKGEQRESNFVNRGFEVGIRIHKPNEIFDEELKLKQFTYDDWHEQEYSEEHSSICNSEEESQKILSNNKIHRR